MNRPITTNVVVHKSGIHGKGVFAARDIKRGEFILVIDDSDVVTDPRSLTENQRRYQCDYLENGKIVILKAPERYTNHSCNPDSYTKTVRRLRRRYAMRNIRKGEEITADYAINGYGGILRNCNCGSKQCRRRVRCNFFRLPRTLQKRYYPYLDRWFKKQFKRQISQLSLFAPARLSKVQVRPSHPHPS